MIDKGIEMLIEDPRAESVRPITISPKHPYKMWCFIEKTEYIEPFLIGQFQSGTEPYNMGRNQLPVAYVQVGAMEVLRYKTLMKQRSMSGNRVRALLVCNPLYTVNIDTELDFMLAEVALQNILERETVSERYG